MDVENIKVGTRLNDTTALQLTADLTLLPVSDAVQLDFSQTTHFEPFAMLLVSAAANRLRERLRMAGTDLEIPTKGLDAEGIAAHMGFWQSMGVALGRPINAEARSGSYLPITRIGVDEIYRESGGANPLASGVIEKRSQKLAIILAQPRSEQLVEALTYAFRELLRNVIEHAMTPAIWVAGMSWPRRDYVQVAVLDEGRGIRRSLADNPQFQCASDVEAIRMALRPGVSRNLGRQPAREAIERFEEEGHALPEEVFRNSGYGLYMISALCREAGQFLVASGAGSLAYIGGAEVQSATAHHGTALRLALQPSEVPGAWENLFATQGGQARRPLLSASTLRRLGLAPLGGEEGQRAALPSQKLKDECENLMA